MKYIKFLAIGVFFGFVLTKAEIVSWYRIYEMFRFKSFHMYGIIGSAVVLGAVIVQLIKRSSFKNFLGGRINFAPKLFSIWRYLFGGTIFGLGWALGGACPGPMYILLGNGYTVMLIVLASAMLGTFAYGVLRPYLPH